MSYGWFFPKEYGVLFNLFFIVGWGEEGGKKLEYTISSRYAVQKAPHALKEPFPPKKKNTITLLVNTSIKKNTWSIWHTNTSVCIFLSLHIHQGRGFFLPPCGSKLHCIHAASPQSTERHSDRLPVASSRSSPSNRSPGGVWVRLVPFEVSFGLGSKVILLPIKGWDVNGWVGKVWIYICWSKNPYS